MLLLVQRSVAYHHFVMGGRCSQYGWFFMIWVPYFLFGVNSFFMLVLEIEASKPPRNDLKVVSIIEMTLLYDARYSFVLLRPKSMVKLSTQSAESQFVWENGLYQV